MPFSRCPRCGRNVELDWQRCPYCDAILRRLCRKCGKPISKEWISCPHCGNKLRSYSKTPTSQKTKGNIGMAVFMILLVSGVSFLIYSNLPDADFYYEQGKKLLLQGEIKEEQGDEEGAIVKYEEAILKFDKAIDKDPSYAKAWYFKAVALYGLGRDYEAKTCYDKSRQLGFPG